MFAELSVVVRRRKQPFANTSRETIYVTSKRPNQSKATLERKLVHGLRCNLCSDKLDQWIMQFKSFHWLSHHGNMRNYTMLYKYGKRKRNFGGRFYLYFSLVFYILGAFLIKQLFHLGLLDMK